MPPVSQIGPKPSLPKSSEDLDPHKPQQVGSDDPPRTNGLGGRFLNGSHFLTRLLNFDPQGATSQFTQRAQAADEPAAVDAPKFSLKTLQPYIQEFGTVIANPVAAIEAGTQAIQKQEIKAYPPELLQAFQHDVDEAMRAMAPVLNLYQVEMPLNPFEAQQDVPTRSLQSESSQSTQAFPQELLSALSSLDELMPFARELSPEIASQLLEKRAQIYDILGDHQQATSDLQEALALNPEASGRLVKQAQLRRTFLETSQQEALDRLNSMPESAAHDPQQKVRYYYMKRIQDASLALHQGEFYSSEEMLEAQANARRASMYLSLQQHYREGRLTRDHAQDFALSPEQFDRFFVCGHDALGRAQLEYSPELAENTFVQDEKIAQVVARLDYQRGVDLMRDHARTSRNVFVKHYLLAKADYEEARVKGLSHLLNRAELGLQNFLNETRNRDLGPEIQMMRADALQTIRALSLDKIDRIRQLTQLEALGSKEYGRGVYDHMTSSFRAKRLKQLDQMEKALRTGRVENFDAASARLSSKEIDQEFFRWISFFRLYPDSTLRFDTKTFNLTGEEEVSVFPSVGERLTPEAHRDALRQFSQVYQANHDQFLDENLVQEGLTSYPTYQDLVNSTADEEQFVARYKAELRSDLETENVAALELWEKEERIAIASEQEELYGGSPDDLASMNKDSAHLSLILFKEKYSRDDLDFPQRPSRNNKPEDYEAILEAMARHAYAHRPTDHKALIEVLEADSSLSPEFRADLNYYIEEFDPKDEWLNLRRGAGEMAFQEGAKFGAETAASSLLSAGLGGLVKASASGLRLFATAERLNRLSKFTRLGLNVKNAELLNKARRAIQLYEKVGVYGAEVAADILVTGEVGYSTFAMPFAGDVLKLGSRKGRGAYAKVRSKFGKTVDELEEALPSSAASTRSKTLDSPDALDGATKNLPSRRRSHHASSSSGGKGPKKTQYSDTPSPIKEIHAVSRDPLFRDGDTTPYYLLVDEAGDLIPATRENISYITSEKGWEVATIQEPGQKAYLISNMDIESVGVPKPHLVRGHSHPTDFKPDGSVEQSYYGPSLGDVKLLLSEMGYQRFSLADIEKLMELRFNTESLVKGDYLTQVLVKDPQLRKEIAELKSLEGLLSELTEKRSREFVLGKFREVIPDKKLLEDIQAGSAKTLLAYIPNPLLEFLPDELVEAASTASAKEWWQGLDQALSGTDLAQLKEKIPEKVFKKIEDEALGEVLKDQIWKGLKRERMIAFNDLPQSMRENGISSSMDIAGVELSAKITESESLRRHLVEELSIGEDEADKLLQEADANFQRWKRLDVKRRVDGKYAGRIVTYRKKQPNAAGEKNPTNTTIAYQYLAEEDQMEIFYKIPELDNRPFRVRIQIDKKAILEGEEEALGQVGLRLNELQDDFHYILERGLDFDQAIDYLESKSYIVEVPTLPKDK